MAVLEAGRGRICAATYHWQDGEWQAIAAPRLTTWRLIAEEVTRPTLFSGEIDHDGLKALGTCKELVAMPPAAARLRRAGFLAEIGWQRLNRGQTDDPTALVPFYLQHHNVMQQIGPYTIRPMTPADIPTVVTIDRLSFPTPWPTSSYVYELARNSEVVYSVLLRPPQAGHLAARPRRRRPGSRIVEERQYGPAIGYVGFRLKAGGTHVSTLAVPPQTGAAKDWASCFLFRCD